MPKLAIHEPIALKFLLVFSGGFVKLFSFSQTRALFERFAPILLFIPLLTLIWLTLVVWIFLARLESVHHPIILQNILWSLKPYVSMTVLLQAINESVQALLLFYIDTLDQCTIEISYISIH